MMNNKKLAATFAVALFFCSPLVSGDSTDTGRISEDQGLSDVPPQSGGFRDEVMNLRMQRYKALRERALEVGIDLPEIPPWAESSYHYGVPYRSGAWDRPVEEVPLPPVRSGRLSDEERAYYLSRIEAMAPEDREAAIAICRDGMMRRRFPGPPRDTGFGAPWQPGPGPGSAPGYLPDWSQGPQAYPMAPDWPQTPGRYGY